MKIAILTWICQPKHSLGLGGGVVRTQKVTVIPKERKGLTKIQNKGKGKMGTTTKLF